MAQELTKTDWAEPVAISVAGLPELKRACDTARNIAKTVGFRANECEEIVLVVSELASNLIEHASGGIIRVSPVQTSSRTGIRLESEDCGPGIPDFEKALTDGYSTRGSLGIGLGTVNRLMDDLEFYANPQSGIRLVSQRWLRPRAGGLLVKGMDFGVATRSYHLMPENGD